MKRIFSWLLGLALLTGMSGCSICQSQFDDTYAAYGGRWQRTDRAYGRVGSLFTDSGTRVTEAGELDESATIEDIHPDIEVSEPLR